MNTFNFTYKSAANISINAFSVIPVSAAAQAKPNTVKPQKTWCGIYRVRPANPSFGKKKAMKPQTHWNDQKDVRE